jgi:hypothetical protein
MIALFLVIWSCDFCRSSFCSCRPEHACVPLLHIGIASSMSLEILGFFLGMSLLENSYLHLVWQLFDRAGLLYGELARFVLRLLGMHGMHGEPRSRLKVQGSPVPSSVSLDSEPKEIGGVAWDHVWSGKDVQKCS